MSIWTVAFWKGAAERLFWALVVAFLGILTADSLDILRTNWQHALVAALLSALISFLKSILVNASGTGPVGSASAVFDRPRDYGLKASDGS
jgi:hypothetical protein